METASCSRSAKQSTGWPEKKKWCSSNVIDYWNVRDELVVVGDIIVKGDRVLIPQALRQDMLKQLHAAHLGMEKTKQRARQVVFWPGLGKEIEEVTKTCETCARYMRANPKQPLLPFDPPKLPWEAVGCDLLSTAETIWSRAITTAGGSK